MSQWEDNEDWVPPQFLTEICHVPDSEVEQEERSSYVPHCDMAMDHDLYEGEDGHNLHEGEDDAIHNTAEMEEAQLIGDGDVEDANEVSVMSSGFTDLLTLSGPDNADCLMQIHHRIH